MRRIRKILQISFSIKEKAGFSIEAALILPLALIFVASLILIVNITNYQQLWHSAGVRVCQELELVVAAVGSFPQAELNGKLLGKLSNKLPAGIAQELMNKRNGFLSAQYLLRRQAALFNAADKSKPLNKQLVSKLKGEVEIAEQEHVLKYKSSFDIQIFYWSLTLESKFTVPLWNLHSLSEVKRQLSSSDKEKNKDSIWSDSNFSRGDHFQQKYGANLPRQYPVISSYKHGVVTSIKSIDLTNPNLNSLELLAMRLDKIAGDLSSFNGYSSKNGKWPTIKATDIRGRHLLLVIPENTDVQVIARVEALLSKYKNITFAIIKDEASYKYAKET